MRRRNLRTFAAITSAGLIAGLASGCSPDFRGQIGLTLDAMGALSAVVETCGQRMDGADLIDGTVERDHYERLGLWKHDRRLSATAAWLVSGNSPGGTWTTIRAWDGTVPQQHRYVLQAGQIDGGMVSQDHAVSHFFSFSSADLGRLSAGMVLRRGPAANPDSPVLQTLEEFERTGCQDDS